MEIPKTSDKGGWNWLLLGLLFLERAVAWYAFSPNDLNRDVARWENAFWLFWGLGGLLVAVVPLLLRHRAGGWLSALSSLALIVRACIPLLGEKPAADAVLVILATAGSLTFAFLYEQSYWPLLDRDKATEVSDRVEKIDEDI